MPNVQHTAFRVAMVEAVLRFKRFVMVCWGPVPFPSQQVVHPRSFMRYLYMLYYTRAVGLRAIKKRLINSGFYDLATVYQSVCVNH